MRSMARFIVQTPCLRMGRARAMQSSSNFRKLWVVMVRQESPHVEGREAAKRAERAQGLPSCMLHPHRRLHLSFRGRFVETCAVWMVRVGAWMSK
jgi:hypothetical protein